MCTDLVNYIAHKSETVTFQVKFVDMIKKKSYGYSVMSSKQTVSETSTATEKKRNLNVLFLM